jgi:hypothetical protein
MKRQPLVDRLALPQRSRRLTLALQHYLGHKNIQHTVRYDEVAVDRESVAGISSLCDFCHKFDLLNRGHDADVLFP